MWPNDFLTPCNFSRGSICLTGYSFDCSFNSRNFSMFDLGFRGFFDPPSEPLICFLDDDLTILN